MPPCTQIYIIAWEDGRNEIHFGLRNKCHKKIPPPEIRPAGGCMPTSSVPDSAYQLACPHSRRQRTTRRAVLRPPLPRLPAHGRQRPVWPWLLRRWLLRRWLLRRWMLRRWLLRRWLLRRWMLRRWLLWRWLLRRCGLEKKRTPPSVCTAAQNRPPPSPWAGCAAAGRRAACLCYQARHGHQDH